MTLISFVLVAIVLPIFGVLLWYYHYYKFYKYLKHVPEIKPLPIIGSALEFPSTQALYTKLLMFRRKLGTTFWTMLGVEPMLFVSDPNLIEAILSSSKTIDKSKTYTFLQTWLGQGLLTSTGEHWRTHRKILTPAFHFKILEDFVNIFDSVSDTLIEKLSNETGNDSTNIFPYLNLYALDVVCESAMGTSVNAQENANSSYVQSVKNMGRIVIEKTINVAQQFNITYYFTENYGTERDSLKLLHNFTNSVINQRIEALKNTKSLTNNGENGKREKQKMAFLDLILNNSANNELLTKEHIREEVDTFMFAGHDTTTAALCYTMFQLSQYPDVQEKAFAEIKDVLEQDKDRSLNYRDIQNLKYLELVIKETMRLYPSVPMFGRELKEDLVYDNQVLPKGLTIGVMAYVLHREAKYFPDPEKFDPDRFLLENVQGSHPFTFLPFSAGPRNCIGQKFAMLAMKLTLCKVLRNFELLPVKHYMELAIESILKSKNGVLVGLKKRQW